MLMTLPEMWDFLSLYLQYSFVQRAMIVTVLVALCSALLGVTLVLRRFSFYRGRPFPCGLRRHGSGGGAEPRQ